MRWSRVPVVVLGAAAVALGACGGGGGGGNTCSPAATQTITIATTGLSATQVCLNPGGTVTFVNNDAQQDHLVADACTALASGVSIDQGSSKQVNFPNVETCTFHVQEHAGNSAFQGLVAITQTGGY